MFVIGIAGGSGSGKSTLANRLLASEFAKDISIICHDSYYFGEQDLPDALRRERNWDHPDALDTQRLITHIDELIAGRGVDVPVYDFASHSRAPTTQRVEPRSILIVEGVLVFAVHELRERLDLRIFVDTSSVERTIRRVMRDVTERGRSLESIANQLRSTVQMFHDQYIEPSRRYAHIIVPCDGNQSPEPAFRVLISTIASVVNKEENG